MITVEQVALPIILGSVAIVAWFLAGRLDMAEEARRNPENLTEAIYALEYAVQDLQRTARDFQSFARAEVQQGGRVDRFFLQLVSQTINPLVYSITKDNGLNYVFRSAEFPHRVWADLEAEVARAARNPRSQEER